MWHHSAAMISYRCLSPLSVYCSVCMHHTVIYMVGSSVLGFGVLYVNVVTFEACLTKQQHVPLGYLSCGVFHVYLLLFLSFTLQKYSLQWYNNNLKFRWTPKWDTKFTYFLVCSQISQGRNTCTGTKQLCKKNYHWNLCMHQNKSGQKY
jgi:hypothetical protein